MTNKNCDCGHGHDHEDCDCPETITITLDDDVDVECEVLDIFNLEGQDYVTLLPLDDEEILVFRYIDKGENFEIDNLQSDEEYEMVSKAVSEMYGDELLLEDEDFDEDDEDDFDNEDDDDDEE